MKWDRALSITNHLQKQTFRSLYLRNYRLYFIAQTISASGTWVQLVAENWLVIRLNGSGLALGITAALQFTPLLLFSAYGGVLVDRWNKRNLLTFTQSASGLIALALGLLTLIGSIQIWMIWIAAFLFGCINAVDSPGRQTFTMEMVGSDYVTNAVALNSTINTSARAIGPAISGLLISAVGIGPCFIINALSYGAVVAGLRLMKPSELHPESIVPRRRGQVQEGLRYVWHSPPLRTVLLIMALASTFALNFQILLPLFTSQILRQGPALYGLLMAFLGIGSLIGSLVIASLDHPTVRRIVILSFFFGIANIMIALAPNILLSFLAVSILGATSSLFLASCSGSLQRNAGDGLRGRVMALYSIAFLGTGAIGGPLVGLVAQFLGPRAGFILAALACIVACGFAFFARSQPEQNITGKGAD